MNLKIYSKLLCIVIGCIFLLGTSFAFDFSRAIGIENEYDLKRMLVLTGIAFLGMLFCFVKDPKIVKLSRGTTIVLTVFTLMGVLSALNSQYPFWGGVELTNYLLLFLFYCLSATTVSTFKPKDLAIWLFYFAGVFSVLTFIKYILFLFFSYTDAQAFNIHGLLSGYVNVRFFNQLQVMIFGLLLIPIVVADLKKFNRITLVLLALHWMVLLQTEARGGILSLLLALCIICIVLDVEKRAKILGVFFKSLLLGTVLWLVFILLIPYFLIEHISFQVRTSSSGRLDLWWYVIKSIPEQPWLGYGPMSFAWAEGRPLPNAHPHNSVIQLLYEYGIFSCVVVVMWGVSKLNSKIKAQKQANNAATIPFIYCVLSGIIYSLFSGVVVMPFAQILFIFLLATLQQNGFVRVYKLTLIGLFLLVSTLSCLLLATYNHQELLPALFPRIWINGLIAY